LDFEAPRRQDFPALDLATMAGQLGGTRPAVLNAANEVAVDAFLSKKIAFPRIWKIVAEVLATCPHAEKPDLDTIITTDTEARRIASTLTD
jgi:1-deoxy-D-xylulose-5-phosphate reductoisomerase